MSGKSYALEKVFCSIDGVLVKGYEAGDAISITFPEDDVVLTQGCHGEVGVGLKPNNIAEFTLRIAQTAQINDYISGRHQLLKATGFGAFRITVKDLNGTSIFSTTQGFLSKLPNLDYGLESGNREYVFRCVVDKYHVGGNIVAF